MSVNDVVMQSYGRCCASTCFFDDFYRTFLASSAEIRDKFQNTDMPAQKQLLRQGILNLVLYARGLPPTKLKALAESHSRHRLNIEPHLYELWLDALLKTIDVHDRDSDRTVLQAWEQVLRKGIEVIKTGY